MRGRISATVARPDSERPECASVITMRGRIPVTAVRPDPGERNGAGVATFGGPSGGYRTQTEKRAQDHSTESFLATFFSAGIFPIPTASNGGAAAPDPCDCCTPGLRAAKRRERDGHQGPDPCDCGTPGPRIAKRHERGDLEGPHLCDCCTSGHRMAKRYERGDLEGPHLYDCCRKRASQKCAFGRSPISRTTVQWSG